MARPTRIITSHMVLACPIRSFDLTHYKPDGTCWCNDHAERMKKEETVTKAEIDALIGRLESQHFDLNQGAHYMPHEDPDWDATLDACRALRVLMEEMPDD